MSDVQNLGDRNNAALFDFLVDVLHLQLLHNGLKQVFYYWLAFSVKRAVYILKLIGKHTDHSKSLTHDPRLVVLHRFLQKLRDASALLFCSNAHVLRILVSKSLLQNSEGMDDQVVIAFLYAALDVRHNLTQKLWSLF